MKGRRRRLLPLSTSPVGRRVADLALDDPRSESPAEPHHDRSGRPLSECGRSRAGTAVLRELSSPLESEEADRVSFFKAADQTLWRDQ